MAYICDLFAQQQLYVENQGSQTLVTLSNSSPNQQQSQSTSLTTGVWEQPPTLFQITTGYILQLKTIEGQYYVQIQANQINSLRNVPCLDNVRAIPLQKVVDRQPSNYNFKPMQPMQPMKMGNMEMQFNPMQMRMGNMEMKMGTTASSQTTVQHFCSQCGQSVKETDRFCTSCGHNLNE